MNLWQEMFKPVAPVIAHSSKEIDDALSWLFQDLELISLKLAVIRKNALRMRRAGCVRAGDAALVALWRESQAKTPQIASGSVKLPVRNGRH